ncbi:hypothetical protein LCGC14_1427880 [marine sediment metagenome]|uniref:Uncharacterized protein n=1 Tax=marine sediment metagenome TaxID=412755 RepID=A0A0F9M4X7_9ZZZZ
MRVESTGKFALRVTADCGCQADFCNDPHCTDYTHQMGFREKCGGSACSYSCDEAEELLKKEWTE